MESFVDELVLQIFKGLNANNLIKASGVCKKWYVISRTQCLWKPLVLRRWPSQNWLYSKIPVISLNWYKMYQEFHEYGWYSPNYMKYFVACNVIEDEPISPDLRQIMFIKMSNICQKWMQANTNDYGGDAVARYFDKNMELFFNIHQLEWVFLDKRRDYLDIYGWKSRRRTCSNNMEDYVRPYQVIPSCLLMYRFLCMFRSFAVPETGLTFYRIWRFRLKHVETGLIFELSDWKAASSCTFSNGRPNVVSFCDDALELLHFMTHPHFIMHPLGLNPRVERLFFYTIRASAGGSVSFLPRRHKPTNKKRKHLEAVSPRVEAAQLFGKQLYEKPMFPDIDEKLESWRARRKAHLLQPTSPRPSSSNLNPFDSLTVPSCSNAEPALSRSSSWNTLNSETETEPETDSQREFTTSDCESEFDFHENGYVTNCEYFIFNTDSLDSIEEQHSLQASIADLWTLSDSKDLSDNKPVIYDIEDNNWYFQMEKNFPNNFQILPSSILTFRNDTDPINQSVGRLQLQPRCKLSHSSQPPSPRATDVRNPSFFCSMYDVTSSIIEPIPSCLALYRLICLFDFNCSAYVCFDDASVWQVSMVHKKTQGVIHFKDYNGTFRVAVSLPAAPVIEPGSTSDEKEKMMELFEFYDLTEFRAAVTQLLDLIMSESFCHPYGIVAGTVA